MALVELSANKGATIQSTIRSTVHGMSYLVKHHENGFLAVISEIALYQYYKPLPKNQAIHKETGQVYESISNDNYTYEVSAVYEDGFESGKALEFNGSKESQNLNCQAMTHTSPNMNVEKVKKIDLPPIKTYGRYEFLIVRLNDVICESPGIFDGDDCIIVVDHLSGIFPLFIKDGQKFIAYDYQWDKKIGDLKVYKDQPYEGHGNTKCIPIRDLDFQKSSSCNHVWKETILLSSVVEDCIHCGLKKEDV